MGKTRLNGADTEEINKVGAGLGEKLSKLCRNKKYKSKSRRKSHEIYGKKRQEGG